MLKYKQRSGSRYCLSDTIRLSGNVNKKQFILTVSQQNVIVFLGHLWVCEIVSINIDWNCNRNFNWNSTFQFIINFTRHVHCIFRFIMSARHLWLVKGKGGNWYINKSVIRFQKLYIFIYDIIFQVHTVLYIPYIISK